MREPNDQSRKKVSRNCLLLGAAEVLLGVLLYLWALELLPIPPFPCTGVLSALGFVALGFGAYLLYWGGILWQRAGDETQWRSSADHVAEDFRLRPVLLPVLIVGVVMFEWTLRGTVYTVAALLEGVLLLLLVLPLFRQMRRL